MATVKQFPKTECPEPPSPPFPAGSAAAMIRLKRNARITVRLADELKAKLEEDARANGTTPSNHVVHLIALPQDEQGLSGKTLSDVEAAERALALYKADGASLTGQQRIWIARRLNKAEGHVLAGRRPA